MRQYNIVSADDHVQEPGDTWTKRVPVKLRDRAPRIERAADGDAWVIEGKRGRTMGMEVQGGRKFEQYKQAGETYESIRKGAWDPVQRLKDMDLDGVDAEVIYPNLGIGPLFLLDDLELQFACLGAYNDFLSEWCSTDPSRLAGIALIPTDDVQTGVKELKRVAKLTAIRGAMLPTYPRGEPLNSDVYDPLWATAQDLGLPMHIHLRTGDRRTEGLFQSGGHLRGAVDALLNVASLANYEALSKIIFGGVLENFPETEIDRWKATSAGWDISWRVRHPLKRHRHHTGLQLPNPPSYSPSPGACHLHRRQGRRVDSRHDRRRQSDVVGRLSAYRHHLPQLAPVNRGAFRRRASRGPLQDRRRERGQTIRSCLIETRGRAQVLAWLRPPK